MKKYLVIVVSLTLIVHSQCGLIDGLFGTVKDTTSSIKTGLGGVLHYGKNLVFGGNETTETGRSVVKPGLIGTISLKIHDVSSVIREEVRLVLAVFDTNQSQEGSQGIVGRLFNKVKNRIIKVKSFLFGGFTQIENSSKVPDKLSNDTALLCEKLSKYFFKHNLSQSDSGIKKTMFSLKDAINRIRNNITNYKQKTGNNGNNEEDGTGLIDIRNSVSGIGEEVQEDFVNGIDAGYDKIEDEINERRGKATDSIDALKQSSNNFIENQRNNLQNNFNKLSNAGNNLRSNVDHSFSDVGTRLRDESDKVKDVLENGYSKVKFESEQSLSRGY